jgi:hypothetical protein
MLQSLVFKDKPKCKYTSDDIKNYNIQKKNVDVQNFIDKLNKCTTPEQIEFHNQLQILTKKLEERIKEGKSPWPTNTKVENNKIKQI